MTGSINTAKKPLYFILIVSAILTVLFLTQTTSPVIAGYNGGRLIDDSIFRHSNSMSASQIQSFLESKNSGLKGKKFQLECYGAGSKERQLYTAAGASCSTKYLASSIIFYAATIYDINPRVILATLQKEQSLITTTNPTSWQLSQAMGYACPTSGSCSDSSNFSYQIDAGTWVLRWHFERANRNNSWWSSSSGWTCGTKKSLYKPNLYPAQNVTFIDQKGVAYRTHKLVNPATSALYCYTPHAYNNPKGLYGLPKYGTKGMYYTGSYNFVKSFEAWFGSTRAKVKDQTIVGDWSSGAADEVGLKRGSKYLYDFDNDGTANKIFGIGRATDKVIVGDWDGDGTDSIGLRRGAHYYLINDNEGGVYKSFGIGRTTDKVIVGDWDGNVSDSIGLKRGNKYYLDNNHDGNADVYVGIGRTTDKVIVGDWNGNGKDSIGLKRGNYYYFDFDHADNLAEASVGIGRPTDRVIVGDWDGDGKDSIGLKRYNRYYYDNNHDGSADVSFIFGYY